MTVTKSEPTVKSRPILFSGEMVRAILSGQKVVTRRPVVVARSTTSIPRKHLTDLSRAWADSGFPDHDRGGAHLNHYLHVPFAHPEDGWAADPTLDTLGRVYCPLGVAGDELWVRETVRLSSTGGFGAKTERATIEYREPYPDGVRVKTFRRDEFKVSDFGSLGYDNWTPSIHMPRWASRITLEILSVRPERVGMIMPEDAKAEGIEEYASEHGLTGDWTAAFARLWDETYGETEHSWDRSPWVWVVKFRRVEQANRDVVP